MPDLDAIRKQCWTEAVHCFATAFVFEDRARRLKKRGRLLTFLGIVLPASVGATAAAFGLDSPMAAGVLTWTAGVGVVQLIGSIWSLVNRWDDDFAYFQEAHSANRVFFDRFCKLAKNPPEKVEDASRQLELIEVESNARSITDEKQGFSEDEKRMGMRAALRELGMKCAGCDVVPKTMDPSNCGVCGSFNRRRW